MRCAILSAVMLVMASSASAQLTPAKLRTESLANPVGVDIRQPRFSWQLAAPKDSHDQRQTAYRIVVASSREKIEADTADLWDSGKVASDDTLRVGDTEAFVWIVPAQVGGRWAFSDAHDHSFSVEERQRYDGSRR